MTLKLTSNKRDKRVCSSSKCLVKDDILKMNSVALA